MMYNARIVILSLLAMALCSCGRGVRQGDGSLPERHPSDFMLGLVVFGAEGSASPGERAARYIIEPGGVFRASFGAGSDAMTYPPMTRVLDEVQQARAWGLVRSIEFDQSPWRRVNAPELEHHERGSVPGYLLELQTDETYASWSTPIDTDSARALATWLASLAWVRD